MTAVLYIRLVIGIVCLLASLTFFIIEVMGVFKMKYVLNRMHAAAIGDTMCFGMSMVGLMLLSGWNFTTLKFFLVMVFLWLTSPVSSHLIARLELSINEESGHDEEVEDK